ncbi:MAG: exo-beta-N-acetylmuramidase NamZ domain-containing protein [Spirochaetales bacterium]
MSEVLFGLEMLTGGEPDFPVYRGDGSRETVKSLRQRLARKRVAVLTHPAGVDAELNGSVGHLLRWNRRLPAEQQFTLTALLGPQHGFAGEKQDNMIESDHTVDAETAVPIFSLYGETRRITEAMAERFDMLLFDLQDVGVRVYTFLTTLAYIIADFHAMPDKAVVVLDRPNPTGRSVEGLRLEPGEESFVGAATAPMQHGMSLGEFALWYTDHHRYGTDVSVVPMSGRHPTESRKRRSPADGWPADRVWIPPSPNMPGLHTARAYPGTVMLEGTTLSEARGTTRPLSMFGHPDIDWAAVYRRVETDAPETLEGYRLREVVFEPVFHKHAGMPTRGFDIVCEYPFYDPGRFSPYRFIVAVLRAVRDTHPRLKLWTDPPYEYEYERMPIDVICGGPRVRRFVEGSGHRHSGDGVSGRVRARDDAAKSAAAADQKEGGAAPSSWQEFSALCSREEAQWRELTRPYYLYGGSSAAAGRGAGGRSDIETTGESV